MAHGVGYGTWGMAYGVCAKVAANVPPYGMSEGSLQEFPIAVCSQLQACAALHVGDGTQLLLPLPCCVVAAALHHARVSPNATPAGMHVESDLSTDWKGDQRHRTRLRFPHMLANHL